MKRFLQVFCAVFSGIVAGLAISNEFYLSGSPFIGLFSLIPLYLSLSLSSSYKESALMFGLQAIVLHLISSFWLGKMEDYSLFTLGASAIGTSVVAGICGYFAFFPFTKTFNKSTIFQNAHPEKYTIAIRVLWFTGVYTLYEWLKSSGFLAYPWGTIYMSMFSVKSIIQIVDIFGVYSITFLLALFSSVCSEILIFNYRKVHILFPKNYLFSLKNLFFLCAALFMTSIFYGTIQYSKPRNVEKLLNTVLVQQNLDPWLSLNDTDAIRISKRLTEEKIESFSEFSQKADLVVWSEAVLRHPFPSSFVYYTQNPEEESLISFIKRMKTPFIIGAPYVIDAEKGKFSNAAILFDKNGLIRGNYGKRHLVPFAEIIPFEDYEIVQMLMNSIAGFSHGWTPGLQYTVFDIPAHYSETRKIPAVNVVNLDKSYNSDSFSKNKTTVRISTPICFEDAFPDVCGPLHKAGTEIFMNITDDSWSKSKSAEFQHFVISSFRAIEYRTTLVRCTNSGLTVIVDPAGKIIASLPRGIESSLALRIPSYQYQRTVYSDFGNWFCWTILTLLSLFAFLYAKSNCKPIYISNHKL